MGSACGLLMSLFRNPLMNTATRARQVSYTKLYIPICVKNVFFRTLFYTRIILSSFDMLFTILLIMFFCTHIPMRINAYNTNNIVNNVKVTPSLSVCCYGPLNGFLWDSVWEQLEHRERTYELLIILKINSQGSETK